MSSRKQAVNDLPHKAHFLYEHPITEPHEIKERKAKEAGIFAKYRFAKITKKALKAVKHEEIDSDSDDDTGVYGTTVQGMGFDKLLRQYSDKKGGEKHGRQRLMGGLGTLLLMVKKTFDDEKKAALPDGEGQRATDMKTWDDFAWQGPPRLATTFTPEHQYCTMKGYEDKLLDWFDRKTTRVEKKNLPPMIRVKSPTRPMFSLEMTNTKAAQENFNFEMNNSKNIISYANLYPNVNLNTDVKRKSRRLTTAQRRKSSRDREAEDSDDDKEDASEQSGPVVQPGIGAAGRLTAERQGQVSVILQRAMDLLDALYMSRGGEIKNIKGSLEKLLKEESYGAVFNEWTKRWIKEFNFKVIKRPKNQRLIQAKETMLSIRSMPQEYLHASPGGPMRAFDIAVTNDEKAPAELMSGYNDS